MKALTGSVSKATVESFLERRVGSITVSDHQRHDFCLRPLLRNDKAFNFRLLQLGLAQRKGFQPLRAIESKTQEDLEDLETADPVAQDQQTTNDLKFVHVKFQLQKQCMFGEQFFMAGDDPMFGLWEPEYAIPMTWSDGHVWNAEMAIPTGKSIQFKFILKKKGGDIEWQPGPDRIFQTWETMNRVTVCEDWEKAELQKILEEDESAHLNEEAQINSEMSMVAENLSYSDEEQGTDMAEDSSIEDSQTHVDEKPLAEPDLEQIDGESMPSKMEKPLAIVAENIGSSEHLNKKTSQGNPLMNMTPQNKKFTDSLTKETIMHDFEHKGKAASIRIEEDRVADGKLFELEESPVLVPGLTQSIAPTEEAASDEVEERIAMDSSIEAIVAEERLTMDSPIEAIVAEERITMDSPIEVFETEDQNVPEVTASDEVEERIAMDSSIEAIEEDRVADGKLFELEESPVLVPGLTQSIAPTEEAASDEVKERIAMDSSIEAIVAEERLTMDSPIEAIVAEERITMDSPIEAFETEDQNVPEATASDEVEERIATDISIEAFEAEERIPMDSPTEVFETEDQNVPEIDEAQKSDDGLQQETNAAFNNKEELQDKNIKDNSHLATTEMMSDLLATTEEISDPLATTEEISEYLAKEEQMSDSEPTDSDVLKNDIQWGRATLIRFLTRLGLA